MTESETVYIQVLFSQRREQVVVSREYGNELLGSMKEV
jgi:hypothetical protein